MANSEAVHGGSELPEAIIQHILSFLRTEKDAIRASSLSKAWLNAWQTRSILHFHEDLYHWQVLGFGSYSKKYVKTNRGKFVNYVNRSLQRYREQKIGIEKFKLVLSTSLDNEWITVAVENGVKRLEFYCNYSTLPRIIFEAKSLLELSVRGYRTQLKLPVSIKCRNLKSLHLCRLSLDEFIFQRIISSCQMIEDLKLSCCYGIENFKVTKVPKLKQFLFSPLKEESVEVEAPNLEVFTCLSKRWRLSLNTSQNLKSLELIRVGIGDEFFLNFEDKFPGLEDLRIKYDCNDLRRIKMSSASLRRMQLETVCWNGLDGLEELQIDSPSMTWFMYDGSLIPKVSFTSASSHCRSHFRIWCWGEVDTSWFAKFKEFLRSVYRSKVLLSLCFDSDSFKDATFDVEETKEAPLSAAPQVDELSLEIESGLLSHDCSTTVDAVVDGVFWACRPKTIRLVSRNGGIELEESLFEKLIVTRNQEYYDSQHIKFWEWNLKEVRVQKPIKSVKEWDLYTLERDIFLDWENWLDMLGSKGSIFELEWETS